MTNEGLREEIFNAMSEISSNEKSHAKLKSINKALRFKISQLEMRIQYENN